VSGGERLPRLLTLSLVAPGQCVRVMDITAGPTTSHRLRELGIVSGARLSVVQDDGNSLLLAVGDTRLAVARGLALNMMDMAHERKLQIDAGQLSQALDGVPVVEMTASQGKGIDSLKQALALVLQHIHEPAPAIELSA
jgi:ferrous iron transport protein A